MAALVERLKLAAPTGLRGSARGSVRGLGRLTSTWRPLPEFLVIGTKRGGTTTLFRALQAHPLVLPMFPSVQNLKSPHYFDLEYERGEAWYRSHFPTGWARRSNAGDRPITGESSPYYLFHPLAPERVGAAMPDARLIAVLRDPVERAFSHYWDRVKEGVEDLSFADALDREEDRLAGESERLVRDPGAVSASHEHHSYIARGRYAEQLERWFERFPRRQILVLRSEDLFQKPDAVSTRAVEFLGLPPHRQARRYSKLHSHADRPVIPPEQAARLRGYFASHNRRLAELLGTDVWW